MLRSLQSESSNRDSQLAALSRQLETVQQQIDPITSKWKREFANK